MLSAHEAVPACPGFCGRTAVGNQTDQWSECGACLWGSRSMSSLCVSCHSPLALYDWMYLAFMLFLPMIIHCFCVHHYYPKKTSRNQEFIEILCCIFECIIAGICAILVFPPYGKLELFSCSQSSIKEWYPALYNPVVRHMRVMRCSHELVFPLYTLPFVFLFFLLLCILLFRSLLYIFVLRKTRDAKAYYCALLNLPKIAIGHSVLAGLVYYAFPYFTIATSLCLNAVHLAMERRTSVKQLFRRLTTFHHISLVVINMGLFAFAIVSICAARGSLVGLLALLLIPIPPIFYVLTVAFTHPSVLSEV